MVGEAFVQQQHFNAAEGAATASSDAAGGAAAGPGAVTAAAPTAVGAGGGSGLDSMASATFSGAVSTSPPSGLGTLGAAGGGNRWDPIPGNVHVPTPLFDYVPPHLISLFITDMGGRTPSYVYRLLTEYYSRDDYFLSREVFGKDAAR